MNNALHIVRRQINNNKIRKTFVGFSGRVPVSVITHAPGTRYLSGGGVVVCVVGCTGLLTS